MTEPAAQHLDPIPAINEVLLDVAVLIELTDRDREIAERRYVRVHDDLIADKSPFAPLLKAPDTVVYAQGSMATGTTILSGDNDDRFDVDLIVDAKIPNDWTPQSTLQHLEQALAEFPYLQEIERCTRCVQLRFADMHLDVTVLDRSRNRPGQRPGEIAHAADDGSEAWSPANPYGFAEWFRNEMSPNQTDLREQLMVRRAAAGAGRLDDWTDLGSGVVVRAEQEPLPVSIPPRLDAQEAVALKLLKRFRNIAYANRDERAPPSVLLACIAASIGLRPHGVAHQLDTLAAHLHDHMKNALENNAPFIVNNPAFQEERFTDRWPGTGANRSANLRAAIEEFDRLRKRLGEMSRSELPQINQILGELFGTGIARRQKELLVERYRPVDGANPLAELGAAGPLAAPALIGTTAEARPIRDNTFHSSRLQPKSSPER